MAYKFIKSKIDDPNDLVSARRLNLGKLKSKLNKLDIEVIELQQIWRHIHGIVKQQSQIRFIKISSTSGIARATRNEVRWNRYLNSEPRKLNHFIIPKVYEAHNLDGLYFYLADYYEAAPLCQQANRKSLKNISKFLEKIAQGLLEIQHIPPVTFAWDKKFIQSSNPGKLFFQRALNFYLGAGKPKEAEPLLSVAEYLQNGYKPALNHGDFTPWHLLVDKKKNLILTDGEWGSSRLPSHYDLAYCYQRLAACTGQFEAAAKLANLYRSMLSKKQSKLFDSQFRAVLAERTIGGFWDLLVGQNTASGTEKFHLRLKKQILRNELF